MELTLNEAFGIINNSSELDNLRNDAALKFFRIIVCIENEFKAEFKAVQKAQNDGDKEEINKLAKIEKDIEFEPLTYDELKSHGVLSVKVLREFRAIIDSTENQKSDSPSESEQSPKPTHRSDKK